MWEVLDLEGLFYQSRAWIMIFLKAAAQLGVRNFTNIYLHSGSRVSCS